MFMKNVFVLLVVLAAFALGYFSKCNSESASSVPVIHDENLLNILDLVKRQTEEESLTLSKQCPSGDSITKLLREVIGLDSLNINFSGLTLPKKEEQLKLYSTTSGHGCNLCPCPDGTGSCCCGKVNAYKGVFGPTNVFCKFFSSEGVPIPSEPEIRDKRVQIYRINSMEEVNTIVVTTPINTFTVRLNLFR